MLLDQKKLLETYLEREITDSVFYRVCRDLKKIGVAEDLYANFFPLIGELNKFRRRIAVPPVSLLDCYQKLENLTESINCSDFQTLLESLMEFKPNPRELKGKIYLSPTWYKWFSWSGIPFNKDKVYPNSKYLLVASHALTWDLKKQKELN